MCACEWIPSLASFSKCPCLREAVETRHSEVFPFLIGVISCHLSVQFCSELLTAFWKVPCILTPPGLQSCAFLCWYYLLSTPAPGIFQFILQGPSSTHLAKQAYSPDSVLLLLSPLAMCIELTASTGDYAGGCWATGEESPVSPSFFCAADAGLA